MLMTSKGQSVRIKVSQIRETGRNAQGVKLMTLNEGETIQDVATVVAEELEVAAEVTSTEEGAPTDGETTPEASAPEADAAAPAAS